MSLRPPSPGVISAFNVESHDLSEEGPTPILGGENRAFRYKNIFLKPVVNYDTEEAEWAGRTLDKISVSKSAVFSVSKPFRSEEKGNYVFRGWTASEFVPNVSLQSTGHWQQLLTASRAFHRALRDVPLPRFLRGRDHAWAIADRIAWDEEEIDVVPAFQDIYKTLNAARRPLDATLRNQVVHSDLSGNVLFSNDPLDSRPPLVIDFSPMWRPVEFAEAIIVVDAMLWHEQEWDQVVPLFGSTKLHMQVLIRAILFRLVSDSELCKSGRFRPTPQQIRRYAQVLDWLIERVTMS